MLAVTTTGSHSHVGSQALGEVHHRLVDVFLWQLFADGLLSALRRATNNSSVILGFNGS